MRLLLPISIASLMVAFVACTDSPSSSSVDLPGAFDAGSLPEAGAPIDTGDLDGALPLDAAADAPVEAAKVLPDGLLDPIPYLSRGDSPFNGVVFASYSQFEDWEDHALNTPGVTADSNTLGSSFGGSFVDSVDGDDGTIDGKCAKADGSCDSAFGGGSISFTFDAAALGALPTHVGIAWTDGSPGCDAIFEAYDATDTLIGSRTAVGVGDADNLGGTAEDRFFGVVHSAGVKKIVVKSSAGGVEVDHLTYGR